MKIYVFACGCRIKDYQLHKFGIKTYRSGCATRCKKHRRHLSHLEIKCCECESWFLASKLAARGTRCHVCQQVRTKSRKKQEIKNITKKRQQDCEFGDFFKRGVSYKSKSKKHNENKGDPLKIKTRDWLWFNEDTHENGMTIAEAKRLEKKIMEVVGG